MTESLVAAVLLPIGLGLFGFIEPCTIGSTLIFVKVMEGRPVAVKLWQVGVFTATRALFIGTLGVVAVLAGSAFIDFQKAMWIGLGALYVALDRLAGLSGRAPRWTGIVLIALGAWSIGFGLFVTPQP